uniref:DDE-1 domain-containing protein n=1 Tax=Latimeria chalumnae TaxID=7897 RepID=H3BE92_LATCH
AQKHKLKVHNIETKFLSLQEVVKGQKTISQIVKDLDIPSNTLSTWIKHGNKIKLVYENQIFGPSQKCMRTVKYSDVEEVKIARAQDVPVSGSILQIKAEKLATGLGHIDFSVLKWMARPIQGSDKLPILIIGKSTKPRCFKDLIQKLITCVEKKEEFSISVLNALHMLQHAWNKVIPTTITNCFRHAGFTAPASTQDSQHPFSHIEEEKEDKDDLSLAELLRRAAASNMDFGGATFEKFVAVDDSVVTTESLTDNNIIEQVQDEESEGEDDNGTEPPKRPSHTTAMEMCTVLRHYL